MADQFVAPQFFILGLILVFGWAFSGAVTTAVLSILSAVIALYIGLGLKEPALFLQVLATGVLFLFVVSYLQRIQKKTNDQMILRENLLEGIHLAEQEISAKNSRMTALEHKINRLSNLHRFSEELKELNEVRKIAESTLREARESLGTSHACTLYLVDEVKEELVRVASSGGEEDATDLSRGTLYDQWVMKRSQGLLIEDARNDFRFHMDLRPGSAGRRSICASPLLSENRVLGVIRLSDPEPHVFHTDDLRLLDILAGVGAVNLRNALLYQKMRELATRDSLTGLYVNRYFMEQLSSEIRKADLSKSQLSVILLDIDFFKKINDEYGHVVGDIVLKNIAAILVREAPVEALTARYGGEEFVLFLPGQSKKEALRIAESIRGEVEKDRLLLRRAEARVTASLGVATFPEQGRTPEEILWKADQCLYAAKQSGRNRVCGST